MVIDDESPADTKLIICQNSKPWSNFQESKTIVSNRYPTHTHPKQSKAKQLWAQQYKDNRNVREREKCKWKAGQGWVWARTTGDGLAKGLGDKRDNTRKLHSGLGASVLKYWFCKDLFWAAPRAALVQTWGAFAYPHNFGFFLPPSNSCLICWERIPRWILSLHL